ncbi:MAG: hypothetical protein HC905_27325 [Bacteroidales bacterium]|nr:hypothetical protein [Bacteroidales bacterium]
MFFHSNLGVSGRWYFTLNKRIKNQASGNNLSGIYTEFGVENIASYSNGNLIFKSSGSSWTGNGFHVFQSFDPHMAVGFQRRFNNWSYFDIFVTANHTYGALNCDLGFRLGFAWGK